MTTINKPFRLETMLELVQKGTEKATQEVSRLMNTRETATQKLALLSDCRNNYHQQMLSIAKGGMDVTRLRNYVTLIDRLGNAMHQQKGAISAPEQQLAISRTNWLEKQRREQSFDILRQHHIEEQRLDEEHRIQHDNDKRAAKVIRIRTTQGGNWRPTRTHSRKMEST